MMSNVPKLRFKEFGGEWEEVKLESVCDDIFLGLTSKVDYVEEGGYPFIRASDINTGKLLFDKVLHISEEQHKKLTKKRKSKRGDVLVSKSGSLGTCAIVDTDVEFSTYESIITIQTKDEILQNTFLVQILQNNRTQYRMLSVQVGSIVGHLNIMTFRDLFIFLPSKQEQEKIASFLTSVDTKIEQLTKKEALLSTYKKGVMQKIFSGEIRFKADDGSEFCDWEETKLGDISYITTGKSNREDSGLDGPYTFFDRSEDIRTSNIYLFDKEAIIIAGEGSDFPPKYFKGKFDLHQRTYAIMDFKNSDAKYLFFYLHFHRSYFVRYAVGSTVKSLRLPTFQNMDIKLPSIEEQTKIANFLSSINSKIEQVKKQLNSTKEFKKALLQQMFV